MHQRWIQLHRSNYDLPACVKTHVRRRQPRLSHVPVIFDRVNCRLLELIRSVEVTRITSPICCLGRACALRFSIISNIPV